MKFTAVHNRAITWFCKEYNVKPSLSVPPTQMYFTDKATGLDKEAIHLDRIVLEYSAWKKEDQARRALEQKQAKALEATRKLRIGVR